MKTLSKLTLTFVIASASAVVGILLATLVFGDAASGSRNSLSIGSIQLRIANADLAWIAIIVSLYAALVAAGGAIASRALRANLGEEPGELGRMAHALAEGRLVAGRYAFGEAEPRGAAGDLARASLRLSESFGEIRGLSSDILSASCRLRATLAAIRPSAQSQGNLAIAGAELEGILEDASGLIAELDAYSFIPGERPISAAPVALHAEPSAVDAPAPKALEPERDAVDAVDAIVARIAAPRPATVIDFQRAKLRLRGSGLAGARKVGS
jgi:hypothetical protein